MGQTDLSTKADPSQTDHVKTVCLGSELTANPSVSFRHITVLKKKTLPFLGQFHISQFLEVLLYHINCEFTDTSR